MKKTLPAGSEGFPKTLNNQQENITMCKNNDATMIDEYKVLRQIAKNDHSILYEAVGTGEGAGELHYIIKEFLRNDSSEEMDKELRLTQMIENQLDVSVAVPILKKLEDGRHLVMLYRRNGRFLSDLLTGDSSGSCRLGIEEAINLTDGILTAVGNLHSFHNENGVSGILHLDLHPGNIFYESFLSEKTGETGTVKLIDFSNAFAYERTVDPAGKKAQCIPSPKGSTVFSAPEITERKFTEISRSTDLYSVGALFFYMITGELFSTETCLETCLEKAGDRLSLPSVTRYALKRFLQCALSYNPLYRYTSSEEMSDDLHNLQELNHNCKKCNYPAVVSAAYDLMAPFDEISRIPLAYNDSRFREAVIKLDQSLHTSNADIQRCRYAVDTYLDLAEKQKDRDPPSGTVMASLMRSGILCCNNMGDHSGGDLFKSRIEQYKDYLSVPEYLNLQLNLAEQDSDRLKYRKALDRTERTIECFQTIENAYVKCTEIMGQSKYSANTKELGRAYSARGRYLSFLSAEYHGLEKKRTAEEAEKMFRKALQEFNDSAGNKEITMCHILHLAVECRNRALYEEFAVQYFGWSLESDPERCLRSILEIKPIDVFKLFIFVKCLYNFHRERISSEILNELRSFFDESRKPEGWKNPFIPVIYRYLGCMVYSNHGTMTEEAVKIFFNAITYFGKDRFEQQIPLSITTVMAYQTWSIYNELAGIADDNHILREMLMKQSRNSQWDTLTDLLEKGRDLPRLLLYEYA